MTETSYRVRRCEILVLEPRETSRFDLACLLEGGNGMRRSLGWTALAPHLGEPVCVDAAQREMLGAISPSQWRDAAALGDPGTLQSLLDAGLILHEHPADAQTQVFRSADDRQRSAHWHPLAAVLHAFSRWSGVDAVANTRESGADTAQGMRKVLGPPPLPAYSGVEQGDLPLADPIVNAFDALLARRVTCRNFDDARSLPADLFATMLSRVFGARAQIKVGDDLTFAKKSSPSGGGLHPMDAYLIVQAVEGLAPGLYRYASDRHCLHRIADDAQDLRAFAMDALGQQDWFANAHCIVALVPRFDRTFWKYRRHEKGYRVVALEAGHLSQTLYLAATDLGLGAFITGAINERALEQAFGLDHVTQGALALCGFGWRASTMRTAELDPLGLVWTRSG